MLKSVMNGLSGVPVIWREREGGERDMMGGMCVDVRLVSVSLVF